MGNHTRGARHRSGSYQEFCTALLARLGGLPEDEPPAAVTPAPEWVSPDEWARQHSGKAAR